MARIIFHGLPYELSEASAAGRLEKSSRTLSGSGETFHKGDCFSPARKNIDIATTIIPQNSGIMLILS